MENLCKIAEYFKGVETTKDHDGYFCSVWEALAITILGSFCGLVHPISVFDGGVCIEWGSYKTTIMG
jgi:hypothetical protein